MASSLIRKKQVVQGGDGHRILLYASPSITPQYAAYRESVGGSGWNRTNDPRLIKTVL